MSTDDASGDDLPTIDVHSPAERATDAGRAGFGRLQDRLRESHLDVAALLWMVFLAGLLAVEIYGAFSSSRFETLGDSKGWTKATLLAQSGNSLIIFGSMIGIALAAWADTGLARAALAVAVVLGAWATVANLIGVAAVFHRSIAISFTFTGLSGNRGVATVGQLMLCGLGAVVVFVAGMLLASRRSVAPAPEIAETG